MSLQNPPGMPRRSPTCIEATRALRRLMDQYGLAANTPGYIMLDQVPAHHNLKVLLQITAAGRVVIKRKQRDERSWNVLAVFDTGDVAADNGWAPILVADHTTDHLRFLREDQGDDRRLPGTIEVGPASGLNPSTYDEWVDYLEHMIPWLAGQIMMPGIRLLERGISPH